jgi:hypothetical protein
MRTLGYLLLLGSLTLLVMTRVVFFGEGIDAYYRSRLVDMVHGTAHRPYVYRVLVPGLARVGTAVLPQGVKNSFTAAFDRWPQRPAGWLPAYAAEYVLVLLIMSASLIGFASAVRHLFRSVFAERGLVSSATALVGLACLPIFFGPFSRQIYDFTTLWLFTFGLASMARSRWGAFAVLFPLACLNKETSILLTLVFVVHFARARNGLSSAGLKRLLVYQLAVFVLVRASVTYAFRDNPGEVFELHLFGHNQLVLSQPGLMSKRLFFLVGVAIVGAWGWRRKPPFLRHSLVTLAPVLLIMGVTVGMLDEIRAYYEIYPVVVLLFAESVCTALGIPIGKAGSGHSVSALGAHV